MNENYALIKNEKGELEFRRCSDAVKKSLLLKAKRYRRTS